MCAINDTQSLMEMRAKTSRIIAWKLVQFPSGKPDIICVGPAYKPGWNHACLWNSDLHQYGIPVPPTYIYRESVPAGIHAYLNGREEYGFYSLSVKSIEVEIEPKDVLACESELCPYSGNRRSLRQIVALKIWINPQEWKNAGFAEEIICAQ